ncbi:hypothetical protein [Rhodoferax sp. BLA1]|uniref:hypothetical protein n=1 Tax=Rhodoferax sp. BLA1 TaxID=2576062 RepID=UPI0015D41C09|nr:hypothetical protein [Rhodoferax sp. BLA1]
MLALIPFLGSLLALTYEAGYLSFYDVPITLVQLDFVRIVRASAVVGFFALLYLLSFVLVGLFVQGKHPVRRAFGLPFAQALLLVPIFLVIPGPVTRWWVLAGLMILSAAVNLVPPLFRGIPGTTYTQRLSSMLAKERVASDTYKQERPIAYAVNNRLLVPLGVLFFATLIVFAMGRNSASEKTVHWLTKEQPRWLLVANYGDTLVLRSYDVTTRQVGPELRLAKATEVPSIVLVRERTGIVRPHTVEQR